MDDGITVAGFVIPVNPILLAFVSYLTLFFNGLIMYN